MPPRLPRPILACKTARHHHRVHTVGLWAAALAIFVAAGCDRPPEQARFSQAREVMGTLATVTAVAPSVAQAKAAVAAAYTRLDDVNRLMSDYVDESEIGRLNRATPGTTVPVSPETLTCVRAAVEIGRASNGTFDITCRPIVALWKSCGAAKRLPSDDELLTARAKVGLDRIRIDESAGTIALDGVGMQLDLGGIAKGYALDLAADAMFAAGASAVLVDVGGDVLARGPQRANEGWRVGVKHPFDTGIVLRLLLIDRAVATSGNQQRFYDIEGKRYSHIVDPRTGRPAEEAPSVTVIARDGLTADAWATALSVLSVAEGQALLAGEAAPDIDVLWITGAKTAPVLTRTPGFDAYRDPDAL